MIEDVLDPALIRLVISCVVLGAFIFTVIITCLSLVGWVKFAKPYQQNMLFSVLIVELVAVCLAGFKNNLNPSAVQSGLVVPMAEKLRLQSGELRIKTDLANALSRTLQAGPAVEVEPPSFTTGRSVLWVDDNPENNVWEREVLQRFGVDLVLSSSASDASGQLERRAFDTIISDMGRSNEPEVGLSFLGDLRARGDHTRFLIYTGQENADIYRDQATELGADEITGRPDELLEFVLRDLFGTLFSCNGQVITSGETQFCKNVNQDLQPFGYAYRHEPDSEDVAVVYEVTENIGPGFRGYATSDPQHQGPTRVIGYLSTENSDGHAIYQIVGGARICSVWNGVLVTSDQPENLRKYGGCTAELYGYTAD